MRQRIMSKFSATLGPANHAAFWCLQLVYYLSKTLVTEFIYVCFKMKKKQYKTKPNMNISNTNKNKHKHKAVTRTKTINKHT